MTILYNLTEALSCLLYFVFSILTLETVFSHSAKYRFLYILIAGFLYFPLTYSPFSLLPNLAGSLLSMGIVFALSLVCYSGKWIYKFLAILLFNIFDILIGNIFFYIGTLTTNKNFSDLSVPGSITRIYILILIYLSELMILFSIRRKLKSSPAFSSEGYTIISLFLLCSFLVVLINYYILFYLSEENDILEVLGLISTCIMLIIIFVTLFLFHRLQTKSRLLQEYELLNLTMEQQEKQLHYMQESEQRIREIRHDMKNYFLSYESLLKTGKVEEVIEDIHKMISERLNAESTTFCQNQLVSAMLIQKNNLCHDKEIAFSVRVALANTFDDIEMIVVLSNILDNAIEAEEKLPKEFRRIFVEILPRPNAISMLIENTILSSVLDTNPELHTTKSYSDSHGIGLKSVKRLLEKRNGLIEIFEENEKFCVHIYFPVL